MERGLVDRVEAVLADLRARSSPKVLAEMGPRYGIVTDKAMGVAMNQMQAVARPRAPNHALAEALWETGWYEARIVACMVDDPGAVSVAQMDRWRADFDNWGIVDTVCFKLFDQVACAPAVALRWCALNDEMGRRAGFALLACMALHGKGEEADFLLYCMRQWHEILQKKKVLGVRQSQVRRVGKKRRPTVAAAAAAAAATNAAQVGGDGGSDGDDDRPSPSSDRRPCVTRLRAMRTYG